MTSVLSSSAKGASFLIFIQVSSRALTFVFNQLLLRYLSPELLGIANQLELYSISVLYFARESLRVALQRQTGDAQTIVNIAYIPIALGFPLAYLLAVIYVRTSLPDVAFIVEAVGCYAVAAIIELFSEPFFVVVQQKLLYGKRAVAETTATFAKCVMTLSAAVWWHRRTGNPGILPFAFGELCYASVLLTVYYGQMMTVARKDGFSFLPQKIQSATGYVASYFSRALCILGLNLYLQSAVKYLNTRGDSFIIASLASLRDQGAYALASNYGSLIARVVFQPIEETSRNLFAKLCASPMTPTGKGQKVNAGETTTKKPSSAASSATANANIRQAHTTLTLILRFYSLLTLAAFTCGPPLAPQLLSLIAGPTWRSTSAPAVLGTYTYYIPFLAFNGITEAFFSAVATTPQLQLQSAWMFVYLAAFASSAWAFLSYAGLGAQGLVWANCVNLGCRIVNSGLFIRSFFKEKGLTDEGLWRVALPETTSIAAAVAARAVLWRLEHSGVPRPLSGNEAMDMVLWGGAVAVAFCASAVIFERDFLTRCYTVLVPAGEDSEARKKSPTKRKKVK